MTCVALARLNASIQNEQLDEIVVDRIVGPLHDEDVASADVFEDAHEDVAFAEDMRLRPRQLHVEVVANCPAQSLARAAGKDLQFAVGIRFFGRVVIANQRFVHAHSGRSS